MHTVREASVEAESHNGAHRVADDGHRAIGFLEDRGQGLDVHRERIVAPRLRRPAKTQEIGEIERVLGPELVQAPTPVPPRAPEAMDQEDRRPFALPSAVELMTRGIVPAEPGLKD